MMRTGHCMSLPSPSALFVNEYLPAVGLISVLWDHLLTIDYEVSNIWTNDEEGYLKRAFFVMNRYATEALLVYNVYGGVLLHVVCSIDKIAKLATSGLAPNLNLKKCVEFQFIYSIITASFFMISKGAIAWRIYSLWDHRRLIGVVLIVGLVLSASIASAFFIVTVTHVHTQFNPVLGICFLSNEPGYYPAFIGTLAAFDIFAILLIVLNAFDRPYQTNADVIIAVQRDGARFFIMLLVLRLVAFVMSLVRGPDFAYALLPTLWAYSAIVNSRLHFRLSGIKLSRPEPLLDGFEFTLVDSDP